MTSSSIVHWLLAPESRPRKSPHIALNRVISRNLRLLPPYASNRCPAGTESIDQNQGLPIWRADLAENKEAMIMKSMGARAAPMTPPKQNSSVLSVS
jgi:hypothetical protein